jgi:hypothetical protein
VVEADGLAIMTHDGDLICPRDATFGVARSGSVTSAGAELADEDAGASGAVAVEGWLADGRQLAPQVDDDADVWC